MVWIFKGKGYDTNTQTDWWRLAVWMVPDSVLSNLTTPINPLKYSHQHTHIYLHTHTHTHWYIVHMLIWGIVFVDSSTAYGIVYKTTLSMILMYHGKAQDWMRVSRGAGHSTNSTRGGGGAIRLSPRFTYQDAKLKAARGEKKCKKLSTSEMEESRKQSPLKGDRII